MTRVALLETLTLGLDLVEAAANDLGIELELLTSDRAFYGGALAELKDTRVTELDTRDWRQVRDYLISGPVDGLLSNTDTWAIVGAEVRAAIGLPGRSPSQAALLRNKSAVRSKLQEVGLDATWSAPLWQVLDNRSPRTAAFSGYVVKPIFGTGSAGVTYARTIQEVESLAIEHSWDTRLTMVEPYIPGPVYSAETLVTKRGVHILGYFNRRMSCLPYFREETLAFPAVEHSVDRVEVDSWVEAIHGALGITEGATHIEFVRAQDGPHVIEVNARLGGGLIASGIDSAMNVNPYEHLLLDAVGSGNTEYSFSDSPAGFAYALVYSPRAGTFESVEGLDLLPELPGSPRWHPTRESGYLVSDTADQSAAVGFLSAVGGTRSEAEDRMNASVNVLGVRTSVAT